MSAPRFTIIGENIHASRIVKRGGARVVTAPDGREALAFAAPDLDARFLPIPDAVRMSKDGEKGRIKHVQAALLAGMSGSADDAIAGRAYLQSLALRQIAAGAHWLDLNVDEISADDIARRSAMRWLVGVIEEVATIPLAIDSSSPDVLRAGLEAARGMASRPLMNSASLERLAVLDLAAAGSPVILSAAGVGAMPTGADERVANLTRMLELATARGITHDRIYLDPLVLPAAVNSTEGSEVLAAVRELRRRLGPTIHITGGLSNVSFGLPARRVMNEVFLALFVEAGGDSGIVDPIALRAEPDRTSRAWSLATDVLLGRDAYARSYLKSHRAGLLVAD